MCSAIIMPEYHPESTMLSGRPLPAEGNVDTASVQRVAARTPEEGAARERPCLPIEVSSGETLDCDRYLERGPIGSGGSSVVIRAWDREILRDVAIKVLNPGLEFDGQENDRFAEEARINGQLEHPNIVPIYELGVDRRGRRFLSMKLIEGNTLAKALELLGNGRLEADRLGELLQVFVKVCDAVSFAHSRGVIHRDLKPSNIMMSDFGQVYVLDWGIARLRPRAEHHDAQRVRVSPGDAEQSEVDPPGSAVGTRLYMAPEQIQGLNDQLDERTDVFGLGATFYQILTGRPPITDEIARAARAHEIPPAIAAPEECVLGGRLPPGLSAIAMRALAYEPKDRYPTVAAFKRDIEAFQRGAWDMPRKAFPCGSSIVVEGEPGDAAYVIVEGTCLAYRVDGTVEVPLRSMGPGEVFGETAIFSHKPRSASVKALTDVVLVVVTSEVMSRGLGLNSWMGAFVKAIAERFREADARLRVLERASRPPPSI